MEVAMQLLRFWVGTNRGAEQPGTTFSYLNMEYVRYYTLVHPVNIMVINTLDDSPDRGEVVCHHEHPTGDAVMGTLYVGYRGMHFDALLPV